MKACNILLTLLILSGLSSSAIQAFHSSKMSLMSRIEALDIFGLSGNPNKEAIKSTYRNLAFQHHPDMPKGNMQKFQTIQSAHSTLMKNSFKENLPNFSEQKANELLRKQAQQRAKEAYAAQTLHYEKIIKSANRVSNSFIFGLVAFTGYNYWTTKIKNQTTEKTRKTNDESLTSKTHFEKALGYISGLATSAKANTWDQELFGYKDGGKVATVATAITTAGAIAYLAYKKKSSGKKTT